MTKTTRAIDLIKRLRTSYTGCRTTLEFQVSHYMSGDHNRELRREVILQTTGELYPLSKCTTLQVAQALKLEFDQIKIF